MLRNDRKFVCCTKFFLRGSLYMFKQSVRGKLIAVTESHFVTQEGRSVSKWHRDYYYMEQNPDPDLLNFDTPIVETDLQTIKLHSKDLHPIFSLMKKLGDNIYQTMKF